MPWQLLPLRKPLSICSSSSTWLIDAGTAAARALLVKPMRVRATMVMNFMMGEVETNEGSVVVGTEELFNLELNLIYV
jgi:hypothetical protein